jgi:hypothetical protein
MRPPTLVFIYYYVHLVGISFWKILRRVRNLSPLSETNRGRRILSGRRMGTSENRHLFSSTCGNSRFGPSIHSPRYWGPSFRYVFFTFRFGCTKDRCIYYAIIIQRSRTYLFCASFFFLYSHSNPMFPSRVSRSHQRQQRRHVSLAQYRYMSPADGTAVTSP